MEEDCDDKDDSKRKSRNLSEKKRRDQFNALVNDLSTLISTSNRKMDKSTVLKSTIAFLKHHNEATNRSKVFEIQQDWKPSFLTNDEFTHLMLESLDGFIIVFSSSGTIFYASESITSLLGYLPTDLLNMTIFDLSYELDHECLINIFLSPKPAIEPMQTDITSNNQISFYIHLKRGGIEKVDANAYELVKFVGYFRNDVSTNSTGTTTKSEDNSTQKTNQMNSGNKVERNLIFVGTGRIQTPQLIREMSTIDPTHNEFTSKHSMEWKFLFLDHRAPPIIGYMPFEVLGTSGYDYYHFDDLDSIVACHEELMQKGEGKSCYYRFLTKGQQWIWLQTDFYISYHQFNAKPDYVVCTHKVVSYADVIEKSKKRCSTDSQLVQSTKSTEESIKSATITFGEYDVTNPLNLPSVNDTNGQLQITTEGLYSVNNSGSILNEPTAALDINNIWANTNDPVTQPELTPQHRTSRPSSSYGNINSTGISPTVKRKRYISNRGDDSDSTSMSADSSTSKNSLLSQLSSQNRQHSHQNIFLNQQHHHQPINILPQLSTQTQLASFHHHHQHTHTQLQTHAHSHSHAHSLSHSHSHSLSHHRTISQLQTEQKLIPVLPQHPIVPAQIVANNSCQYTQTAFPALQSPQILAPTFIEPSQYLTAIPVQPVIAPFPVAPVLSPIASQPEIIANAAVIMSPTQAQIQEQLQRKHDELQKLIMQQQDELRIVSEQLLLARYTLLQPLVPVTSYNNTSTLPTTSTTVAIAQTGRNYNFNNTNGSGEAQFSQYGFTISSDVQMSCLPDPQTMVEQQQQQQQQHQLQQQEQEQPQETMANSQHHLGHLSLEQHPHNQHQTISTTQPLQSTQTPHEQNPTSLFSRNVPDLDQFGHEDIDAFLNLSPLHSIEGNHNALNQIPVNGNHADDNINSVPVVVGNSVHSPLGQNYVNSADPTTVDPPNDDALLSYMQMAAESSPTLNFPIGISENVTEAQNENSKLLSNPQPSDQQQQDAEFFSQNAFQSQTSNTTSNQLPNDLEILPYQMSQEQSQNLFNSPSSATGTQ